MLEAIAAAIASALEDAATAVDANVVVYPWYVANIAAPTLDVYPGEPFSEDAGFGADVSLFWTVRARLHTLDHLGAQSVLLALMEPAGDTSVREALEVDDTLGGLVGSLHVEGPSAYTEFIDLDASTRRLGVTWRVQVMTRNAS